MDSPGSGGDNDLSHLVPQPAPRKRPLRTYGRRAQLLPDRDSEPPRKKRALEDNSCLENSDSDNRSRVEPGPPSSPQLPKLPQPPAPVPVKRGSILAFFKPMPMPTSSSAPQSQISSDATRDEVAPSSPPSSPPPLPRVAKKRRRLTTRINSLGDLAEEEGQRGNQANEPATVDNGVMAEEQDVEEADIVELGHSSVLRELKSSLLNSGAPSNGHTAEGGFKAKHEAKRRARKPMVQTTLNLSIGEEPGFTICKECEMLYNPLNEKDRKDHATQHAAAMRRKGGVDV